MHEKGILVSIEKKLELTGLLKSSIFSTSMILNLINDLLDLAKIESRTFKLNWNYFDLFEVIAKSAETLDS